MRVFKPHCFRRTFRRKATASLALVAYLISAFGLPLPALATKNLGERYPCEGRVCGCASAEECWRHCCCLTPRQRWAWASANGVEPPSYAERPSEDDCCAATVHPVSEARTVGRCCAKHERHANASCCASPAQGDTCEAHSSNRADAHGKHRTSVPWLASVMAFQCRGVSMLWVSSGAVFPPVPPLTWNPRLPYLGCVWCPELSLLSIALAPPLHPPRRS